MLLDHAVAASVTRARVEVTLGAGEVAFGKPEGLARRSAERGPVALLALVDMVVPAERGERHGAARVVLGRRAQAAAPVVLVVAGDFDALERSVVWREGRGVPERTVVAGKAAVREAVDRLMVARGIGHLVAKTSASGREQAFRKHEVWCHSRDGGGAFCRDENASPGRAIAHVTRQLKALTLPRFRREGQCAPAHIGRPVRRNRQLDELYGVVTLPTPEDFRQEDIGRRGGAWDGDDHERRCAEHREQTGHDADNPLSTRCAASCNVASSACSHSLVIFPCAPMRCTWRWTSMSWAAARRKLRRRAAGFDLASARSVSRGARSNRRVMGAGTPLRQAAGESPFTKTHVIAASPDTCAWTQPRVASQASVVQASPSSGHGSPAAQSMSRARPTRRKCG